MKQDKGEAVFESVDEVLAEKFVKNSKKHGEKMSAEAIPPSPSQTDQPKTENKNIGKKVVFGAIIGIMLLFMGILCFTKCKDCCKR
jgi:hypothetical protein